MKIFIIEGGIGRSVFFTALIPKLAGDEKIIVMSAYPDIFENNPHVYRSMSRGVPFSWNDVIKNSENQVMFRDPYFNDEFIKGKIHVIEAWCKEFGIDYDPAMRPKLYLPKHVKNAAKQFKKENGNFIIIQFTCGQSPLGANLEAPFFYQGFERIYPLEQSQELVKLIKKKYPSLSILNFSIPNEGPNLEGSFRIQADYLFYAAALQEASGFIGVNSSLTHMAAAVDAPGVVLWGGSNPDQWGYPEHINLSGECSMDDSYCTRPYLRALGDIMGDGKPFQCSDVTCMDIAPERVIESLETIIPEDVKKEIKKSAPEQEDKKQCQCNAS